MITILMLNNTKIEENSILINYFFANLMICPCFVKVYQMKHSVIR